MGTEAGGGYFELTDVTRTKVNRYVATHRSATMEEIQERFFADYEEPVPGWMISGRHVEAAGTKTVQILFDGYYNDYFQPDVHYIALKKDFSKHQRGDGEIPGRGLLLGASGERLSGGEGTTHLRAADRDGYFALKGLV